MARKKAKTYKVEEKKEKKMVIKGSDVHKATKPRMEKTFRTGAYKTEKDRPRDKNWRKWRDE